MQVLLFLTKSRSLSKQEVGVEQYLAGPGQQLIL